MCDVHRGQSVRTSQLIGQIQPSLWGRLLAQDVWFVQRIGIRTKEQHAELMLPPALPHSNSFHVGVELQQETGVS